MLRDVLLCSLVGRYQCFLLPGRWMKLRSIYSTRKVAAAGFFETLVPIYQITWCQIPEDRNLTLYFFYNAQHGFHAVEPLSS
jgi:hypothetical protein